MNMIIAFIYKTQASFQFTKSIRISEPVEGAKFAVHVTSLNK